MTSSVPIVEEVTLEKGTVGLGFNIRGGTDNIHIGSDPGIFVTTVKPSGAAGKDGRLQPGDKILEINNHDLREVPHQKAVSFFHDAGDVVRLLIERGSEQRIREQLHVAAAAVSQTMVPDDLTSEEPNTDVSRSLGEEAVGGQGWRWKWPLAAAVALGVSVVVAVWYVRSRRR